MIYLILILELFLLFILSRVCSQQLSRVFYQFSKSQKITIYLTAILFFPGVVLHEISHWLMAQLLFVPTGRVEFMPVLRGDELKLGSVAIAKTDPIRRALIGVAPFLFGSTLLLLILFFYQQLTFIPEQFRLFIVGYSIFEIGNTMFSSRKDLEGTLELVIVLGCILGVSYFFGVQLPTGVMTLFNADSTLLLVRQATYLMLLPLGIDLLLIVILQLLLARKKRF